MKLSTTYKWYMRYKGIKNWMKKYIFRKKQKKNPRLEKIRKNISKDIINYVDNEFNKLDNGSNWHQ